MANAPCAEGVKPYLPLLALVTDRHVDAFALAGTRQQVTAHIIELRQAGIDSIIVRPLAGAAFGWKTPSPRLERSGQPSWRLTPDGSQTAGKSTLISQGRSRAQGAVRAVKGPPDWRSHRCVGTPTNRGSPALGPEFRT
jgi:hypothetical protein